MKLRQEDVQTPHFSFPFTFGGLNGGALVNEQDTDEEIIDCVKVILAYPIGSREDEPTFGIPDLLFHQRTRTADSGLLNSIQEWEPRSDVVITEEDDLDQFVQHFHINVESSIGD